MYSIRRTSRFKKDVKRMKKRDKDFDEFKTVIRTLQKGERLPRRYKDHKLKGNWAGFRDCHIENDWVLIYRVNDEFDELELARTGTHADLFE